jgi:hypothetical protein
MEDNMSNVVFKFPVFRANERVEIERKYCELARDYRNGVFLDPEAIDWMDSANNWLIAVESNTK